jgi:hypothetical protein
MNEERGTTLKVLCILSWVWVGILILLTAKGLIQGAPTQEMVDEIKAQAIEGQTEEQLEQMAWFWTDYNIMLDDVVHKFYQIEGSYMTIYLFGLLATILMFMLKKIGYYLYIIYTLAGIGAAFYFYPNTFAWFFGFCNMLGGAVFAVLYGFQLNRMK